MAFAPRFVTFALSISLFLLAGSFWVAALAQGADDEATPAVESGDEETGAASATPTPDDGDTPVASGDDNGASPTESPPSDSDTADDSSDEQEDGIETPAPDETTTPHPRTHLPIARNVAWVPTPTPTLAPGQLVTTTIGTSIEGRAIRAYRIGNGPKVLVLIGGLHTGPEKESVHIVERLRDHFAANPQAIPSRVTLVFIPRVNPDGYALNRRTNARGVDLNRNWPSANWRRLAFHGAQPTDGGTAPLSEPETRALYDYLMNLRPTFSLSYHGYASLIESNGYGVSYQLSAAYAAAANYTHLTEWPYYEITGQFIDAMEERSLAAGDVELQQNDASGFQRNLAGVVAVIAKMQQLR